METYSQSHNIGELRCGNMPKLVKVLVVFGTRPEAIKLAPVLRELDTHPGFETRICVTAQHREMLDQVLDLFRIEPHHDLNLMRENQSLFDVTSGALSRLESVLKQEEPDIVLVQGDTTTVFTTSLAAYYRRIKIGHVEAGLRTEDKFNPFPEEMNRKLTDALADFCFAPTENARQNLVREGIGEDRTFVTGNTVIDALHMIQETQASVGAQAQYEEIFAQSCGLVFDRRVILVTGHRRESFGADLESICHGLKRLAEDNEDIRIVYPIHLNPNVQKPVWRILGGVGRVHLVAPLEYAAFVWLMSRCYMVLTDSGGVQEEAPSLGKPVLVMRKNTERPEGISAGVARLVGTDGDSIYRECQRLLRDSQAYDSMALATNPYGDGQAAKRIVSILESNML
jgi:UDP-N-acetylglucosamine 2-epimerase (non-hydrolysing)